MSDECDVRARDTRVLQLTYRLSRATLAITMGLLLVVLPIWFLLIRIKYRIRNPKAIIVGDDPEQINCTAGALEIPVLGYLSPSIGIGPEKADSEWMLDGDTVTIPSLTVKSLGGPYRLEQILTDYDISTVVLAFRRTDRSEFFGVLEMCHDHGIEARVLREHADSVLLSDAAVGELVTIDLEPWDWQDRLVKRGFDIAFAFIGIVLFAPLFGLLAPAIKIDSPGPVFYTQKRTADLGSTFEVLKFRTLDPDSEAVGPIDDENNDQITRVGRLLRKSRLDELTQLWSILLGDVSVVGPRAVWTEEESLLERETI